MRTVCEDLPRTVRFTARPTSLPSGVKVGQPRVAPVARRNSRGFLVTDVICPRETLAARFKTSSMRLMVTTSSATLTEAGFFKSTGLNVTPFASFAPLLIRRNARSKSTSRITTSAGISVPSGMVTRTSFSTTFASILTTPSRVRTSRPL